MVVVNVYSRKLHNCRLYILWFLTPKVIYRPTIYTTWSFITAPSFDIYIRLREYLMYWGCRLRRCFSASLYIFTLCCIWCFIFTHSLACALIVGLSWAGLVLVLSIFLFLLSLKRGKWGSVPASPVIIYLTLLPHSFLYISCDTYVKVNGLSFLFCWMSRLRVCCRDPQSTCVFSLFQTKRNTVRHQGQVRVTNHGSFCCATNGL